MVEFEHLLKIGAISANVEMSKISWYGPLKCIIAWAIGLQVDSTRYKCKRQLRCIVIGSLKPHAHVVLDAFDSISFVV